MLRRSLILSALFLLALISSSCNNPNTYTGTYIKIDYRFVDEIEDQAWIKIDGITYTHYKDYKKIFHDSYSIPASWVELTENGKTLREPYNRFSIAIALGDFVDKNSTDNDQQTARIDLNKRSQLLALAILNLHKVDGSEFTVETSPDYPATITIVE